MEPRALLAALTPTGLVSWYRAENDSNDFVGTNHGVRVGGATFAAGQVQQGFTFNGTTAAVEMPASASLNVGSGNGLSIEGWVNPTSATALNPIAEYVGGVNLWLSKDSPGQLYANVYGNSANHVLASAGGILAAGAFQHVALTYDRASGLGALYLNGTPVAQAALGSFTPQTSTSFAIGERPAGSFVGDSGQGAHFGGLIDELSIYSRALSPAEIQAIANSGTEGKTTIVVNTLTDTFDPNDGATSLREAIDLAETRDRPRDVIGFNIPGAGVRTIAPTSMLPQITAPMIIDGYTQPGASPNTNGPTQGTNAVLLVELDGTNSGNTHGIWLNTTGATVRGLVINRFGQAGIFAFRGGNRIEGNFIGTNAAGTAALPNDFQGIWFSGTPFSPGPVTGNIIGGSSPAARNLISGNDIGIQLSAFTGSPGTIRDTIIQGNFIGTNAAGTAAIPNRLGIAVQQNTQRTTIGGSAPGEGNLISGNQQEGISFGGVQGNCTGTIITGDTTTGNVIKGNRIGTDATGTLPVGNGTNGITIGNTATSAHQIGGAGNGDANVIAFNGQHGIGLLSSHTAVLSNSIFANTRLGIHFGANCTATPNDAGDGDSGTNKLQNSPQITTATVVNPTGLTLAYSVSSTTSNSTYPLRVEFFKADSDGQEGQVFLGADTYASAEAQTTKTISFLPTAPLANGDKIVATATDNQGNTSEFSASIVVQGPACTTVVTTTSDTGAGSLREAINCANLSFGKDTISFSISGSGLKTISPLTSLPEITDPVIIDGYTQPGAAPNTSPSAFNGTLLIELDGTNAGGANGLTITTSDSIVRGLVINRFGGTGISLFASSGNTIQGNLIGTDSLGLVALGNGFSGIRMELGSARNCVGTNGDGITDVAERNIISGNRQVGIAISGPGTMGNVVAGNFVGINAIGAAALGNAPDGIQVFFGATGNYIGTNGDGIADAAEGNVISGNAETGVYMHDSGTAGNVVAGNLIGTNVAGTVAVGNGWRGLGIIGAVNNRVGTNGDGLSDAQERNVISGNAQSGVLIAGTGTTGNVVAGNWIGTNAGGTSAMPNGIGGIRISVGAASNRIGTNADGIADEAEANVVAGNNQSGITITGVGVTGNIVAGNRIGIDLSGTIPIGNSPHGIEISGGAANNRIGASGDGSNLSVEGNIISGNSQRGVNFLSSAGAGNFISGNSIFLNGLQGIDLGNNGVTPNDSGDADTGPNNLQNFPEISYATRNLGQLRLTYRVPSDLANSTYPIRVEFFKADADGQEGQTYLGFDTFTAADFAAGGKTVTFAAAAPAKIFDKIVATATDSVTAAGEPANTSEFSANSVIASPWINPRNPLDVDDDTHVAPSDPLAVINYINKTPGSNKPVPDDAENAKFFCDVSGDNFVAPNDALEVINYINEHRSGGGEGESSLQTNSHDPSGTALPDGLLAMLAIDLATHAPRRRRS